MKKKIVWIIILSVLIIGIICVDKIILNMKDMLTYEKVINLNVGDDIVYYIDGDIDIPIKWKNIKDEDGKIYYAGTYKGTIEYKGKTYKITMIVEDDEEPTIEGVKDIQIKTGEEVDLYKNITVSDNSHDELSKEIKGEYDINTPSTYKLTYVVTDKSNNKTESSFNLIVKGKAQTKQKIATSNTSTKGYKIENIDGITYVNGILIANKTYSLPSTYNPGGLLKEFTNNFNMMKEAAAKEGINLYVVSGFRSYDIQNQLYNRYVARDGKAEADTYSARPGNSEHQTGLAADINSVSDTFENTPEGKWLANNCYKYGFIIRYPKGKESVTGYIYESWHIRYVGKDVATSLYNNGNWLALEEYLGITSKY